MININDTTVAVETSAELKNILEGTNTITHIYLANDITLTQGITILGTKTEITIDGLYPTDRTGTIHTNLKHHSPYQHTKKRNKKLISLFTYI